MKRCEISCGPQDMRRYKDFYYPLCKLACEVQKCSYKDVNNSLYFRYPYKVWRPPALRFCRCPSTKNNDPCCGFCSDFTLWSDFYSTTNILTYLLDEVLVSGQECPHNFKCSRCLRRVVSSILRILYQKLLHCPWRRQKSDQLCQAEAQECDLIYCGPCERRLMSAPSIFRHCLLDDVGNLSTLPPVLFPLLSALDSYI